MFTTNLFLWNQGDFSYSNHFEKLSLGNRWLNSQTNLIWKKMSSTTTINRGNLGPVWGKPVSDRWLCFWPNFLSFCWSSLVAFGKFIFQKLVTNQLCGLKFRVVQQDTLYPQQDYEQVKFYKKSSLYFIGWSIGNLKDAADLQLVKNWDISTKVCENLLFVKTFPPSLQCFAK